MIAEKNIGLTLPEVLDFDYSSKNVLIMGNAGVGKDWLARKICTGTHRKIDMDSFLAWGNDQYILMVLEDAHNTIGNTLIWGCGGFRLLRKGYELNSYRPDIVIHITAPTAQMARVYQTQRDPSKINGVLAQSKGHTSVFNAYLGMCPPEERPLFINFENIF